MKSKLFRGKIHEIQESYDKFLETYPKVISTSLCKDYAEYGRSEQFVLIVTYIKKVIKSFP